jgi:hypothetical protein
MQARHWAVVAVAVVALAWGVDAAAHPATAPADADIVTGTGTGTGTDTGTDTDITAAPVRFIDLQIPPARQQTPVWCWLAVGEMVFAHFGVPAVNQNFQCGVIGALSLATNQEACARDCRRCVFPGGEAQRVMGMLVDYPRRAAALLGQESPRLFVSLTGPLQRDELLAELDARRPVIVGINPDARPQAFGASQHLALIVGYAQQGGRLLLIVNDPFPFSPTGWPDPYLRAGAQPGDSPGRYLVDHDVFVARLGWAETFLLRVEGRHPAATRRCFAGTPGGHSTACPAPPLAAPGTPCRCGAARGVVADGS